MKQPLGIVAALYLAGLLLGNFSQPPLSCLFAVSLATAAAALLLHRFRSSLVWPLIILTCWTNLVWHTAIVSPIDLRALLRDAPVLAIVRGTVTATPTEHVFLNDDGQEFFRSMAKIDVTAINRGTNWEPATGQIAVTSPGDASDEIFAGRGVEIYGVLGPPANSVADGLFDFRNYLRRQEIYFQLKTQAQIDWKLIDTRNVSPPLSVRFIRWAKGALALGLKPLNQDLRLEQAVTLGDKTFLTDEVSEPFLRASTYHIFAVDGLRMAIIFGIFFKSFRLLRIPRMACGLILIPLIWFYVALTGWPASAIRASVMLTIVIFGWMLRRPVDVLNSLLAAALIILLWQPQQLFQAGFQLSFFVVLCILLVMPICDGWVQRLLQTDPLLPEELRPRWRRIVNVPLRFFLDLFFSSLVAWLGSIPLVAYYFHIVTPISTIANVVAVPLCVLVLASDLISLLLFAWLPTAAELFNHVGQFLMECIRVTSAWFASWPHAFAYVPMPSLFSIIAYYAVLLAVLTGWIFKSKRRTWKISALALIAILWAGQWRYQRSATYITVLPLNDGSAAFCNNPGSGNQLLIDCGGDKTTDFTMKPYLRAQGVNTLPRLALTVGEARQVGGFADLDKLMPIQQVITSPIKFRSTIYRDVIDLLDQTPGKRKIVSSGDTFDNWTVLYPPATNHSSRADDDALVLRGNLQGTRVLFLSNLGRTGQSELVEATPDLRADIVVAGLPEQGEPLSNALLDAIQPKLIVIGDPEIHSAQHSGRDIRTRLEQRGVPVIYLTSTSAVNISLRKNRWEASSQDESQSANGTSSSSAKNSAP